MRADTYAFVGAQHAALHLGAISTPHMLELRGAFERELLRCHSERSRPVFSCPSPRRAGLRSRGIVATSSNCRGSGRQEYPK